MRASSFPWSPAIATALVVYVRASDHGSPTWATCVVVFTFGINVGMWWLSRAIVGGAK